MLIEITYNVTDVFMSTTETPVYVEISFEQPGSASAVWGSITGTLSNQTDLQNALNLKVPYTGATTNVNLGEYELKAGQVTLDTSPTGTAAVGTIRWNDTTGTSETTLKGGNVIIKNGVDLVARVVNNVTPNTTLTKAAYQAVRVSGAQGQRLAVALAQANNDAGSADTIGLVTETIATNQEGFIMTVGQLEGINTTGSLQGETWVDGDVLYLSPTTAGAITNVKPTGATGHLVIIGYVEYAHANNGKIYVKVMNGWELDELHNVSIVSPANNQGIFYNSTSLLWENKSITTALGYTPVPTTRNITINGVTYDLSADRTWTIAAGISGSGAAGQVTYWTGASAVSGSNNLFWDNTNGRLGIGTNVPATVLQLGSSASRLRFNETAGGSIFHGIEFATSGVVYSSLLGNQSTGEIRLSTVASYFPTFYSSGAEAMRISTQRNLLIGFTTDQGTRLSVSGDTLLRGSGNTSATTALTVQNSSSTDALKVRNDGVIILGSSTFAGSPSLFPHDRLSPQSLNIAGTGLSFNSPISGQSGTRFSFGSQFTSGNASGTNRQILSEYNITDATGGTATYTNLTLSGTISQTGGANGITRGLYVNPTLTAAADFRAIETSAGNVLFGASGTGFFWDNANSRLGIGTNAPAVKLDVNGQIIATGTSGKVGAIGANTYGISVQNNASASWIEILNNGGVGKGVFFGITNDRTANAFELWNYQAGPIDFYTGATASTGTIRARINNNGNISIGTASDLGVRLGVVGDTLLRGSGNTSATTALTVQNSSSTNLFRIRNNGDVNFGSDAMYWDAVNSRLGIGVTSPTSKLYIQDASSATVLTLVSLRNNFNSVGTGVAIDFIPESTNSALSRIIATRQNLVNGYTSLDFQTYDGTATTTALYIAGTANRNIGILNSNPTARLDIPASVTTAASLRIRSGTAPTTPNDGDIWFDGTDIKMRIGGVTKTFTLI